MTMTTEDLQQRPTATAPMGPQRRLWPALDRRRDAVAHLGPNWFAAVMGTGIVANAGATLPVQVAGQTGFALVLWVAAAVLLVVLLAATAAHWLAFPTTHEPTSAIP